MFAVAKIAGKQFVVEAGKTIKIDSKVESKDKKIKLSEILLIAGDKNISVGSPTVAGATIDAEVVQEGKSKKVLVVKHHPKKRYRRTFGHRQDQTAIKILKINEK